MTLTYLPDTGHIPTTKHNPNPMLEAPISKEQSAILTNLQQYL